MAQNPISGPHVLVVMAHPDDESTFSVTLYKIVKEQHGTVDLFIITNGEAGFKYFNTCRKLLRYGSELMKKKQEKTFPVSENRNY